MQCLNVIINKHVGIFVKLSSLCSIVNLGDDADTVGAIYGQLAGAFYGVDAIPEDWRRKCSLRPLIEVFASELLSLAELIPVKDLPLPDSADWSSLYPSLPANKICESISSCYCYSIENCAQNTEILVGLNCVCIDVYRGVLLSNGSN